MTPGDFRDDAPTRRAHVMSTSGRTLAGMTPGQTPQRQIRIPDDPYFRAVGRAKQVGWSLAEIVTDLLRRYAEGEFNDDYPRR